ncbi:DUF4446 family protein [Haloimpatiens sp. FM7315]|uniref:DUF4446 family protein n=1 Tax=Haloimpatiens sp. FM7315 TaxID=3298609 RepID=UPI0035A340CB
MELINEYIKMFEPYLLIAMMVIILILFILVIASFKSISKMENKIRKLTRGVDNKNIEQIIETYFTKAEEGKDQIIKLEESVNALNEKLKGCIQKTSIIRYRAFEDVGSDLSFSIALLDGNNNGVIITGIYSREDSVVYAKPVDRGISRYDLSEEEKEVLEKVIH